MGGTGLRPVKFGVPPNFGETRDSEVRLRTWLDLPHAGFRRDAENDRPEAGATHHKPAINGVGFLSFTGISDLFGEEVVDSKMRRL